MASPRASGTDLSPERRLAPPGPSGGGQREGDPGAPARPPLGPDAAALGLDEPPGDREAQARAAARRGCGRGRPARSGRTSAARRPGRCPTPVSSTLTSHSVGPGATPHAHGAVRRRVPSAFVSRLRSTRSTWSGAQRTRGTPPSSRVSSRTSRASAPRPGGRARTLSTSPSSGASRSSSVSAPASIAASSNRSSTSRPSAARLNAQLRQVVLRPDQPVLDRLEHRLDRGERRAQVVARPGDELAARVEELLHAAGHLVEATRRAGRARAGPAVGRARRRSPRASSSPPPRGRALRTRRAISSATTSAASTAATRRPRPRPRGSGGRPHVEHHAAPRITAPSGTPPRRAPARHASRRLGQPAQARRAATRPAAERRERDLGGEGRPVTATNR